MKKLKFLLSLLTRNNDYQMAQANAAEEAAHRVGATIRIVYAENDSLTQSQQLLESIQSAQMRPDGIVFEPAGTALAHVAQAAASAGIGWAALNKDADYIAQLQSKYPTPVFSISSDHLEMGRIQGQQFGALLPSGGVALYIQGPSTSTAAELRTRGMNQTKPSNIEVRTIRGNWTEESAYKSVIAWLRLSTSRELPLGLVGCQNDEMAIGARRAFSEHASGKQRERFLSLAFTGCDGGRQTGQEWVRKGLLAATVIMPPIAGRAIEMMAQSLLTQTQPAASTLIPTVSFPALEDLTPREKESQSATGFSDGAERARLG